MKRRTLLRGALVAAAAAPFCRLGLPLQATALTEAHAATLRDLASVVLPQSLGGRRATDAVADRFAQWVRDYRAGVPTEHGYGHPRIQRTPPSPAGAYTAQLEQLEQAAKAQGQAFGRLPAQSQRALIESALDQAKVKDLPPAPNGRSVIADLMSFYYQSSEANDFCYHADIGRYKCRPLSVTAERPKPI